jgi:uncharacterized repeat protein (TIGR01451 family)
MATWLFRRRPARRPHGTGYRPAVEPLEPRCLLAQITEFGTGITAGSRPLGITRGADGNLWFTESSNNALGRITPGGTVTQFSLAALQANSQPFNITSGPGGLLYFTENNVGRIGRINPLAGSDAAILASLTQSAVVPSGTSGAEPDDITAGPDGKLWFTENVFGTSKIGSITPDLATINEFQTPTAGAVPKDITAGPDGALWFTELDANQIGRITTAGTVTEFALNGSTPEASPDGITAGPDGNLWFTEDNKIGRITTGGVFTEFPVAAGSGPLGITAGPDGNLWFTLDNVDQIGRISPAGVVIDYGTGITAKSEPDGIVTGPDGNLWFTEVTGNQIGRLIPDVTITGTPVTAFTTTPFSGQVASFRAGDPGATAGDFAVTIDWGDGMPPDTTSGTVAAVPNQPGHFVVNGGHTYANPGNDTITVTITYRVTTSVTAATSPATVVAFADSADLEIQETGPSRATAGGNATYTITMTNLGPADAQDVTLTDAVPDGTTFVSAAQLTGPTFTLLTPPVGGTGTVIADPVALAANHSATFRVVFKAGAARSITNTVAATSATPNRNPHSTVSVPVAVPVQLTLSASVLADYSPAGTLVGTLTLALPIQLLGQFLPPLYGLPAAEANNAAFVLATPAAGEALMAQFRACSGAQASYQVSVHVDVGFGDQVVTLPVTVTAAALPCTSATAPPVLESVEVVRGGKQGRAQELVLRFGTALDPGSAASLGHYAIRLGFTGKGKRRKPILAPLLVGAYDPVRGAVTLRLGKVKGPKLLGTLTVEDLLGLDGVLGNVASVSVDLRPKPSHKH